MPDPIIPAAGTTAITETDKTAIAAVAGADPKPVVTTELGGKAPEPKLGADGKPIEEPKLDADGKPLPKADTPAPFDATKLKLPEGMKVDDPLFKAYTEIMADDKLSPQDRAQKQIDLYTTAIKQAGEANTLAWTKVNDGWVAKVKADPEIGGVHYKPTKAAIAETIDTLGPEKAAAFRQALDVTGIGNHPAFWHGMAAFAKILTEGKHVAGSPAGSGKADMAPKDFFPNSKMS